jgi:putative endonuclease
VSNDQRHKLGRIGEEIASAHLERLGYKIIDRNFRNRFGELDIVASEGSTLVFCEVKTLRSSSFTPWDSLHSDKCRQVRKMAQMWMLEACSLRYFSHIRCDALGITLAASGELVQLDHLKGAF